MKIGLKKETFSNALSLFPSNEAIDPLTCAEKKLKEIENLSTENTKRAIKLISKLRLKYILGMYYILCLAQNTRKYPTPNCARPNFTKEIKEIGENLDSLIKKGIDKETKGQIATILLNRQLNCPELIAWNLHDYLNKRPKGRPKESPINYLIVKLSDALKNELDKWKLVSELLGGLSEKTYSPETVEKRYLKYEKELSFLLP